MLPIETRYQQLVERLKNRGYRITPQRSMILRETLAHEDHPTVEQIFERVRAYFPMTSLATIYKTINMLKGEGEISELVFAGESSRYDAGHPEPHPHLICNSCHKIIDPILPVFESIPSQLAEKYSYKITNFRMDIFGICPDCQKTQAAQAI
jgi:Fur family transcriptional regulator, peroxide stress response regulator